MTAGLPALSVPATAANPQQQFRVAARAARRLERFLVSQAYLAAAQEMADRQLPERPQNGLSSITELREWHRQRGTLHLFYAQFPDEALPR